MKPSAANESVPRISASVPWGALLIAVAIGAAGCATGASVIAASAYRKASVYGTSTAYAQIAPEDAFSPGLAVLAEQDDVQITAVDEGSTRCTAASGDLVLTFRVFPSGDDRSRLSLLVGGGDDADANQELADRLMQQICGRLDASCE